MHVQRSKELMAAIFRNDLPQQEYVLNMRASVSECVQFVCVRFKDCGLRVGGSVYVSVQVCI